MEHLSLNHLILQEFMSCLRPDGGSDLGHKTNIKDFISTENQLWVREKLNKRLARKYQVGTGQ